MRRATTTGILSLAVLLAVARPATAQWDWIKWLEELSGPGHFILNGPSFHFGCHTREVSGPQADSLRTQIKAGPPPLPLIFCDQNPKPVSGGREAWTYVRNFWTASFLTTEGPGKDGTNPLIYPGTTGKPRVSAWTFTAGPAYRAHESVDVGVGVGAMGFSGSIEKNVTKLMIDPYFVLRPLAWLPKMPDSAKRVVEVRFGFAIFPQGFTLADFGATGGSPLNGNQEFISTVGWTFNIARLFGWQ